MDHLEKFVMPLIAVAFLGVSLAGIADAINMSQVDQEVAALPVVQLEKVLIVGKRVPIVQLERVVVVAKREAGAIAVSRVAPKQPATKQRA